MKDLQTDPDPGLPRAPVTQANKTEELDSSPPGSDRTPVASGAPTPAQFPHSRPAIHGGADEAPRAPVGTAVADRPPEKRGKH